MDQLLRDQYAFRPTGSTTAALVSIFQHTTSLLASEPYVALISLDFSKAFDTVRHSTLASKLSGLDIPDETYNWLVNFLRDRRHATRFAGRMSGTASINASVVQGSGVGPSAFVVNASDLHPVNQQNIIVKYADDTYLIVGASRRTTVQAELDHISTWAARNNLRLNATKSRELLIHRRRNFELPPPIAEVERVASMKILGSHRTR